MFESAELTKTYQYNYGDRVSSFVFSEVDIIIPFHGQYNRVRQLIESIFLFTKSNPYLLTLVDDASPNASFIEQVRKMAPVHAIRLPEQRGFAGALQAGYAVTKKPWVVFLHSDCLVQDNHWLQRLGETALSLKSQKVHLIHTRTDNPMIDHPILTPTLHDENGPDRIVETDDPLPLICSLVHRDLFRHIGGFLRSYPLAGYEDTELFYRMKKHKMQQAVCGSSWVHHVGGATINEIIARNKKAKLIMEGNYDLCMQDLRSGPTQK